MDDVTHAELESILVEGARQLGICVAERPARAMVEYLLALLQTNEHVNLTRIAAPRDAVRLHLLDSLAAAPELGASPAGPAIDIGSGGGFPGVPLALHSGREFVLLDSVGKKAAAVQAILDRMDPMVTARTVSARAEDEARAEPGHFAVAVARAVAPLAALVELAAPLLWRGGHLIALKGTPSEAELASGLRAAEIVGMKVRGSRALTLPGSNERRQVVVYEKVRAPTIALPRRSGSAQHRPLA